jgi:hypothetical protein
MQTPKTQTIPPTPHHALISHLRLNTTPLHPLPRTLLPLLLKILALLIGTHPRQLSIALLLLQLISRNLALLGLLLIVRFPDLGDLLVARLADAA